MSSVRMATAALLVAILATEASSFLNIRFCGQENGLCHWFRWCCRGLDCSMDLEHSPDYGNLRGRCVRAREFDGRLGHLRPQPGHTIVAPEHQPQHQQPHDVHPPAPAHAVHHVYVEGEDEEEHEIRFK